MRVRGVTERIDRAGRALRAPALVGALAALLAAPASAQTLHGRIFDGRNLSPVPGTMVRLLDLEGSLRALTIADDEGRYQVQAPQPGSYVVVAARLGIEDYRSEQVRMTDPGGTYELNLTVVPSPLALEGIEVNAARTRELSRALRLLLGVSPGTLRNRPLLRNTLMEHAEVGRRISDVVRVSNIAGMEVRVDDDGYVCFLLRRGDCAKVYLDGGRIPPELVDQVPLELIETMVVVGLGESRDFEYEGSILLYTVGWLGTER